jgi:predicted DNA-binding ArsR family transcriptional regulator
LKALDEAMKTELIDLFRGIYTSDDKISELKDSMKQFTASKKAMISNVAEKLEVRPIHIRRAYKEWVSRIENREESEQVDEIVAFLQEFVEENL